MAPGEAAKKTIVAMALAVIASATLSLTAAIAASPVVPKGMSAAEKRMMELQATTPAQDLWENGDWYHDPKQWQRTWHRTKRGLDRLPPEAIAWGQAKRAIKSRVVVLDPPLANTVRTDTVQVEWFGTPIDDAATTGIWGSLATIMILNWVSSWHDDPSVPITFQIRAVGKGPKLVRTFNPQRRIFQEMIYGWETEGDPSVYRGLLHPGTAVMAKLVDIEKMGDRPVFTTSRESAMLMIDEMVGEFAEKFPGWMERNGLESSQDWLRNIDLPSTRRAIEEADSRYLELMTTASKMNRKVLKAPQDPIILIDGKYLLTGPVSGKGRDLFRMANWIIERQAEEIPGYGFSFDDVRYDKRERPARGEWLELATPFPTGDGLEVEWLFTYTGEDETTAWPAWLDRVITGWRQDLAYHVTNVRVRRSPIVMDEGERGRAQAARQMAASAWTPSEGTRNMRAHSILFARLGDSPGSIANAEEAREVMSDALGISADAYDEALADETSQSYMANVGRKQAVAARFIARSRKAEMPVFMVNGQYLVATRDATRTFQVLNWLVAELTGTD